MKWRNKNFSEHAIMSGSSSGFYRHSLDSITGLIHLINYSLSLYPTHPGHSYRSNDNQVNNFR